jgi:hypothetical protein
MAKMVFTNGSIQVNGVDLSDHVADITLDLKVADVDITAMGDGGKKRLPGLQDDQIQVTFWQDFAAAEVDATLYPIFTGGTAVTVKVWANGTSSSSTNPYYSASAVLIDYPPVAGAVGSGLQSKVTFAISGTVTRGTS